jgi:nitroreductase
MAPFIDQLKWRYAVKKYDTSKKVNDQIVLQLQESIRLAPSSFGLQPYRVLFIEEVEVRKKLRAASYDQSQITDASHLIVFAVENNIDDPYVDWCFEKICKIRNSKMGGDLLHYRDSVLRAINRMTGDAKKNWATHQAYLALGYLLFAAAQLGIDANPMEGFIPGQYDEILGLRQKGISSVVIAAIGYRHQQDIFQHFDKVRKTAAELFETI